ncbi:hypothetical protein CYMTET_32069 [Cymbomonas tetramitiformis]|uniref:Uncharacterized protein n=1 Tax=Cymbomonas tetramitiformis TaxID=36881 RepID=A0AAE0FFS9_9CHLO|nr:hypothetical protein CYMTET_32069 [Cymbomonas tetramitiformis]
MPWIDVMPWIRGKKQTKDKSIAPVHGTSPEPVTRKPATPGLGLKLEKLVWVGDIEGVRVFLQPLDRDDRWFACNDRGKDGQTPLICAAARGLSKIAELLLANGAEPNMTDKCGYTALHFAALKDDVAMIKVLIRGGADKLVLTDALENGGAKYPHDLASSREAQALLSQNIIPMKKAGKLSGTSGRPLLCPGPRHCGT